MLPAQNSLKDSAAKITSLNFTYNGSIPGGDLSDRFGFTSMIGGDIGFKFKSHFYLLGGARFLFGERVKEDSILRGIAASGNLILIDDNGNLSEIRLEERGFALPLSVGKIIPLIPSHGPNSGLYIELGAQFIQHRIRLSTMELEPAALSAELKKGYDRLTNGLGIREAIGYRFFDRKNSFNFAIGFEFSQNLTQNRRSINIDTGLRDDRQRIDLLNGLVASWTFPLYRRTGKRIIYN